MNDLPAVPVKPPTPRDEGAPQTAAGRGARAVPRASFKRRASEIVLVVALALGAFLAGLLVINVMMPRLVHLGGEVRVPDLSNLTFEQAQRAAEDRGLTVSRSGERFDPAIARGLIIAQEPRPDTRVRARKHVSVVISLGEEFSSVPALYSESARTARALLERAGLQVGDVTRAPSDELGSGLVIASDPPAETILKNGTPVSLLISSGRGGESFVMPDLLGREIDGVRQELESMGFRVYSPPAAPSFGPIEYQEPPSGSRITRGASIMLQASGRIIR